MINYTWFFASCTFPNSKETEPKVDSIQKINWGLVSAVIIFLSGLPYMWAIYKRKLEKPVVSSWLLWLGIGTLLLISSFSAGVRSDTTLLPIVMGVVNPLIIVCLSLKYGTYVWGKLDTFCAFICLMTVVVWQTQNDPVIGIVGGIIADLFAATPQVVKNWRLKEKNDEPLFPWAMFCFASAITLLGINEWTLKYWLFPIYMTITSLGITLPLLIYRKRI
jgi:uncharacterized protein with PQ loop repeat